MRCEKCNNNNATVRLQKIQNGKISETLLCDNCSDEFEISMLVENIFYELFNQTKIGFMQQMKENHTSCKTKCPNCGISFQEIKKDGNLGCAECYAYFKEPLIHAINEAHGDYLHDGKYPERTGVKLKHENHKKKLKSLLENAIKEENFELAAKLRDKLRFHNSLETEIEDPKQNISFMEDIREDIGGELEEELE